MSGLNNSSQKSVVSRQKNTMTQEQKDRLWYVKEYKGNECACGKTKRERTAFCYPCFQQLPRTYQMALYQDIGAGYEEAYEDAVEWLTNNG